MTLGKNLLCLLLGICSFPINNAHGTRKPDLELVYQWSQLEFDYESDYDRQADIAAGNFIPGQPAPIDIDVYYSSGNKHNKIFVTVPRFQSGVPLALATVSNKVYKENPVLTPYPDWSWHKNPERCNSDRIVSVYRVAIDECDRLWVLDTGRLLEAQTCPPQLLAFDLKTNQLIDKYEIPSSQLESRSILVTPVIDIRDPQQCQDTFVYIADCQTYSLIVYDVRRQTSWRITDKTMYPYPNYGTFSIKGDSFDLMDGILGMALSPRKFGQERTLFYHAMSSPTENWVYTSYLRNQTLFLTDPASSPEIFHTYRGERRTQSCAEAMDKDGIMYFGLMSEVKIACWNTKGEYADKSSTDYIASNPVTLQFASGMKVVQNTKGVQELWIMTSRFQKVAAGTLNPSEINFRIQAAKVEDLIFNTNCKRKNPGHSNSLGSSGGGYGLLSGRTQS